MQKKKKKKKIMFSWKFDQKFYGYSPQLSIHLLVCSQQVVLADYFFSDNTGSLYCNR